MTPGCKKAAWVLLAVACSTTPAAYGDSDDHDEPDSSGALAILSRETGAPPALRARRLGMRRDRFAREQLFDLMGESSLEQSATLRLELAWALDRHLERPALEASTRRRLVQSLITLLSFEPLPSGPPPVERAVRARDTAALALARLASPESLRTLLSLASLDDDERASSARSALRAAPPPDRALAQLGDLLPSPLVKRVLSLIREAPKPSEEERKILKSLTPSSLTSGARAGSLEVALLLAHRYPALLSPPFFESSAWEKALARAPSAGLYVLTILSQRLIPQHKELALRHARGGLRSSSAEKRDAASWSLAVLAPGEAAQALDSKDEVFLHALLRQAHQPALCSVLPAATKHLRHVLGNESVWEAAQNCAQVLRSSGTRTLWETEKEAPLASVRELSARLADSPSPGTAPTADQVRAWLTSGTPATRAAAAEGLAMSSSGSARGLLRQAYYQEDEASVRRGLVAALSQNSARKDEFLAWIAKLDPDEGCRALARGDSDPGAVGFAVRQGVGQTVSVPTRRGAERVGRASPDGFFAIVGDEL